MDYSRQQFYEIRRNYQTFGSEGLIDPFPGPWGPHPNRVIEGIGIVILEHSASHKSWLYVASGLLYRCQRS